MNLPDWIKKKVKTPPPSANTTIRSTCPICGDVEVPVAEGLLTFGYRITFSFVHGPCQSTKYVDISGYPDIVAQLVGAQVRAAVEDEEMDDVVRMEKERITTCDIAALLAHIDAYGVTGEDDQR